jgi:hypothetical protein
MKTYSEETIQPELKGLKVGNLPHGMRKVCFLRFYASIRFYSASRRGRKKKPPPRII